MGLVSKTLSRQSDPTTQLAGKLLTAFDNNDRQTKQLEKAQKQAKTDARVAKAKSILGDCIDTTGMSSDGYQL